MSLARLAAAMEAAQQKFVLAAERTKRGASQDEDSRNVRALIQADRALIAARAAYTDAIKRAAQ